MTTATEIRVFRTAPWQELVQGVAPCPPQAPVPTERGGSTPVHRSEPGAAGSTDPEEIRREGLTGRQLRMAHRLARRHDLSPSDDIDAVRLLRQKGIDPFQRNALVCIAPNTSDESPPGVDGTGPAKPPESRGRDLVRLPESSASEVFRIQQDITQRRRRKARMLVLRLICFVLLPTLLAGWYFLKIATPMFSTKSEFVIQQADASGSAALGGLFQGAGLAVQQDSTTVQSYLQSRDAMHRLDADRGFREHFAQSGIDPLQRLYPDASEEDVYNLYTRRVRVGFDPSEGVLKMEVVAADPETSQSFSRALIGYAEEMIDSMTRRLREGQMAGARQNHASAEAKLREAQQRILALQEDLGVIDPQSESGSLMQQITQFEVRLRERRLLLDQTLASERPNAARVRSLEGEIARLEFVVSDLRAGMTENRAGEASLARITAQLKIAEADLETRQILLQQAAEQLEAAMIEANRQVRYMAVAVQPVAQDEPSHPRVWANTLLAFVVFAGIYLLASLTISVLREQVAA